MTPQEKAKELFNKMYNTDDPMGNYPMCFDTAKQCALIAVDEIINSIVITDLTTAENQFIYWEEVKQQIEKL
jgi:hypothetical protein